MKLLSKAYDGLIVGLAILAGLMLVVIFVGIIVDVAIRTVGYNSLQWYSAIAEYCLLFSTMLAAPWLVRLKGHVVVESLTMAMPAAGAVGDGQGGLCAVYSCFRCSSSITASSSWCWHWAPENSICARSTCPNGSCSCRFRWASPLVAIEFGRYLLGYGSYYTGHVGSSESL